MSSTSMPVQQETKDRISRLDFVVKSMTWDEIINKLTDNYEKNKK